MRNCENVLLEDTNITGIAPWANEGELRLHTVLQPLFRKRSWPQWKVRGLQRRVGEYTKTGMVALYSAAKKQIGMDACDGAGIRIALPPSGKPYRRPQDHGVCPSDYDKLQGSLHETRTSRFNIHRCLCAFSSRASWFCVNSVVCTGWLCSVDEDWPVLFPIFLRLMRKVLKPKIVWYSWAL